MTSVDNSESYQTVKVSFNLPPLNVLVKNAIMNMMRNYPEQWNDLIYGKLIVGGSNKSQSLLVGANEDMITMLLVTANYKLMSDDSGYIHLVTDNFPIFSGVASIGTCSSNSTYTAVRVDDDKYYFKMVDGLGTPRVDQSVAIGIRTDKNDPVIDLVCGSGWLDNSYGYHSRLTLVTEGTIRNILGDQDIKDHIFKHQTLVVMAPDMVVDITAL